VRHLPHQLVEAFRSTLEETADADLLVHVVDASDPLPEDQIKAVRQVLVEIGEEHGAMPSELLVVNKTDADGEVLSEKHTPDGTRMRARVGPELATAVLRFALAGSPEENGALRNGAVQNGAVQNGAAQNGAGR
jgi:GTP-binding protein HflX